MREDTNVAFILKRVERACTNHMVVSNSTISAKGAKNTNETRMSGKAEIDQYFPPLAVVPHHQSLCSLYVNEINQQGFL